MKKILVTFCVLSLFVLLVACGTEEIKQEETVEMTITGEESVLGSDTAQVVIEGTQFMPVDLEVTIGTTVEWVNKDSTDHTLTFENGDLDELLPQGATGTFTFNEKGEFRYFCKFHPGMQGSVIVN
jgi:plastocyanin